MNACNIIKTALETADLSNKARDILLTLMDGNENVDDLTIHDFILGLEDGQLLADLGINDQEAVEEAYDFLETLD